MLVCSFSLISFMLMVWKKLIKFDSIFSLFSVIKSVSILFLKVTSMMILFSFINYFSYIYLGVGVSMGYFKLLLTSMFLMLILWFVSIMKNFKMMVGHFLPLGVSGVLKVFIPLTEVLGVLIRPITLAARLATNISCGHVVLMMFSYFLVSDFLIMFNLVGMLLLGLLMIESLVCLIQAHVSWSLLYIYLMDIEI